MLKTGVDTGAYGAVAAFGASFLFARIIEGSSLVGIWISVARFKPVLASAFQRCCWARALFSRWQLCRLAGGHRPTVLGGRWLHHYSGA